MAFLFSGGGLVPPSVHMSDEGPDHASMARPVGTGGSEGPLAPPYFGLDRTHCLYSHTIWTYLYYCYTQIILSSAVLAGHSIERAFVVDFSLERKKIIMEKNRHILILKVNRSYNLKAGQILYFRGRIPFMNFIDMGPQKSWKKNFLKNVLRSSRRMFSCSHDNKVRSLAASPSSKACATPISVMGSAMGIFPLFTLVNPISCFLWRYSSYSS